MNVKLLGSSAGAALALPLALTLGLGLAGGCSGESTSNAVDASADAPDATTSGDASTPDSSSADAATDAGTDGPVSVPGTEQSVKYGSCATFTPCGGDPKGKWTYAAGGCADAFNLSRCPGATVTNPTIKVKGEVTIGATTLDRVAQVTASANVGVPQSCVDALAPLPTTCSVFAAALTAAIFDVATCTSKGAGQGCDCAVSYTTIDQQSTTYTANGNTITTAGGETYDYCVNPASTLTYRETGANVKQGSTLVMTK